jgi:hypothetical protein
MADKEVTEADIDTGFKPLGKSGVCTMEDMAGPEEQLVDDHTMQTYSGWSI